MEKEEFVKELSTEELTPVEILTDDPIFKYAKRDDYYRPFKDVPLSGGKVRQAIYLIGSNQEEITDSCCGNVWTSTSISSPQGIIIGKVARYFGFDSKLFVGAMTSPATLRKNPMMMLAYKCGATINCDCLQAYEAPLHNQMLRTASELGTNYYDVKFGINLDTSPDALVMSTAYQVQNIPDYLDNLVVPSGSCIILSGVVLGCVLYGKNVKNIIGVQISGYDRTKRVDQTLAGYNIEGVGKSYQMYLSKDYEYSRHLNKFYIDGGRIRLDPLYESKAYDYVKKHMSLEGGENLFWIVGDSTDVRNYKIEESVRAAYDEETKGYVKIYGGRELH